MLIFFSINNSTSGEAEHQDVLNALAEENEVAFAKWLISKVGKNYDAIELDEIIGNKSFFLLDLSK